MATALVLFVGLSFGLSLMGVAGGGAWWPAVPILVLTVSIAIAGWSAGLSSVNEWVRAAAYIVAIAVLAAVLFVVASPMFLVPSK